MSFLDEKKILIIGVTASGKSRLEFELARHFATEIISIDSMKVYKRMDIGTAKPPIERRRQVPYHLIDVVEPWESFGVNRFLELAWQAQQDMSVRGKKILAGGGTAMYIKNLLYGLFEGPGTDPEIRAKLRKRIENEGNATLHAELAEVDPAAVEKIHLNDTKRIVRALEVFYSTGTPISSMQTQFAGKPDPDWLVIGLRRNKDIESRRINARVKQMVAGGLIEEARALYELDKPLSRQAEVAIGYAELFDFFKGKLSEEKAIEKIKINTRRLAKAQRTWFKTFKGVRWLDVSEDEEFDSVFDRALSVIEKEGQWR